MEKIAGIMTKLRKVVPTLKKKYGVKYLEVFGSYVRGEQKKGSDLDVLVDFHRAIDLFSCRGV